MRDASPVRISQQHGAIVISTAVLMGAILLFVALAVDTGRLYYEKRILQQQADLAAIQAAQLYCNGFDSAGSVATGIRDTLIDHGFNPDATENSLAVNLGTLAINNNRREFTSSAEFQSVQVVLSRTVASSLFAGSVFNNITLTATGVAERDLIATLSAGNALITVDSDQSTVLNSVLGGLLGSSINLSAASYQGLIDGAITFGELTAELTSAGLLAAGAGLDDLSNLNLSLSELLSALSNAITLSGGSSAAVNDILNAAIAAGSSAETVDLGNILQVDDDYVGNDQADDSEVTPLQLITASLMDINLGDTLNINVTTDTSSLPIIQDLFGNTLNQTVELAINSVPTIAVGRFGYDALGLPRTSARSAALDLATSVNLNFGPGSSGALNALLGTLLTVNGDITVATSTAENEAWLDQISQCPRLLSRQFDFTVGTSPGVLSAELRGANPGDPANLSVDLTLLGLGLVRTTLEVEGSLPIANGSDSSIVFSLDLSQPDALPSEEGSASTTLSGAISNGISSAGNSLVGGISARLLGIPITLSTSDQNTLTNNLLTALAPILGGVAELALDPVLDALGLAVGEVRVQILDVEEGRSELMM